MTVLVSHFEIAHNPPAPTAKLMDRLLDEGIRLEQVKPTYKKFLEYAKKVGDGWEGRPEHKGEQRDKSKAIIEGDNSVMYVLKKGKKTIGFCVAVKGGFGGLSDQYNLKARNGAEIYKIGLFKDKDEDYTHKGYGKMFVSTIIRRLLNGIAANDDIGTPEISSSDVVNLNTRDSNRVNSKTFYQRDMGMELVGEAWYSDLDKDSDSDIRYRIQSRCTRTGKVLSAKPANSNTPSSVPEPIRA